MKKIVTIFALLGTLLSAEAQNTLSLDSCRAMALRNNKQINVSRLKKDVAYNLRKSARTQYLPKVDAMGGYEWFSREISLLNKGQKSTLSNIGTDLSSGLSGGMNELLGQMVSQGQISPDAAQQLGQVLGEKMAPVANKLNATGQAVNDAFRTDTKNIWSGAVMVRQPIFMGGAIVAANKMADIGEKMAASDLELRRQTTLYDIDQAYWLVVSLRQKEQLAQSYRDLVKKLSEDVKKMIREGVATKADGLKVDVKVNEADMQLTQVEDGLSLAKMMLCQLCGLPMDREITLADENVQTLAPVITETYEAADTTYAARPEIQMLENAIELSRQSTYKNAVAEGADVKLAQQEEACHQQNIADNGSLGDACDFLTGCALQFHRVISFAICGR